MASRPTVSVASADGKPTGSTVPLPAVFSSPIRPDIVQYVLRSPFYFIPSRLGKFARKGGFESAIGCELSEG